MRELTKEEMVEISGGLGFVDTTRILLIGVLVIREIAAFIDGRM